MESKVVLPLIMVFIIAVSLMLSYFLSDFFGKKTDITAEISKLNLDGSATNIVKRADCKSIDKHDDYWLIGNCSGSVYLKVVLNEEGNSWDICSLAPTPQEKFLEVQDYINRDCTNTTSEAALLRGYANLKVYNICGLRVYFRGDCVVGVGG